MERDTVSGSPQHRRAGKAIRPRWKFSWLNLSIVLLFLIGITVFTYPIAAKWVSQHNQSNVVFSQARANESSDRNEALAMIAQAQEYNRSLTTQAVLNPGAHRAEGTGSGGEQFTYRSLLRADPTGIMGRLRIPSIDVDLPVYHGTSDETLLAGVGHLQGTSLPVGGEGTRSVLTGHRGLATATMFTNLDKVQVGDTFSVEVLGEVFSYRVFDIRVIDPNDTEEVRAMPGRDLMTLVTCTPLGINSHRILVTGERVLPTPQADLDDAGARPAIPHFPWWIVLYVTVAVAGVLWWWRAGFRQERRARRRRSPRK